MTNAVRATNETLQVLGGSYEFKATGADTANEYTLVEVRAPKDFAIPMHVHDTENEGFFVVSGSVRLVIDDKIRDIGAGEFAFAPSGTAHAFKLSSDDAALLLMISPGAHGHEGMFREMADKPGAPSAPPEMETLARIAGKHGTRIVGAPPA
jgi:quercetin dioxygenase-like cupin family protein